jgi:hypothetical protein
VHHAIDAFFEFNEGSVGGHVADLALDLFADDVALLDFIPWIGFELADAERDLLLVLVNTEDHGFDHLTERENVGWAGNAFDPGKLGDVNETFDALLDFDECAVGHEVGDFAADLLADRETFFDFVPGIVLVLLEAEGDALLVLVDVQNEDFNRVADLEKFARVIEAGPRHVGDVEQAVDAIEVDKRTEVGEVFDRSVDFVADVDR